MKEYDHNKIEKKWQKEWNVKNIYKTENAGKKPKYYVLDMFPYPSGEGLHVGHPRGYIASDVFARMKRMQGYNVLHPMGYDAFGLPAEQYAMQHKISPVQAVAKNVATYEKQLSIIGLSYDWDRKVNTTDPEYYKWTQMIFLKIYDSYYDSKKRQARPVGELIKLFEKEGNAKVNNHSVHDDVEVFYAKEWKTKSEKEKQDTMMKYRLAYEGFAEVNWCPELGTVLANDEIVDGPKGLISERGGFPVEKKSMRQWFMRITAYADRLIAGLDTIDWPENIKEIQKNWIGRSEGSEIKFKIHLSPTLSKGEGEKPGYNTTDAGTFKLLHEKVVEMRKNPTEAESKLWKELKGNHLSPTLSKGKGEIQKTFHFRQQHIINKFIVDFVCLSRNLVIEVDGDIHDLQKESDAERSDILKELGFEILRFRNDEVLRDVRGVVKKILDKLQSLDEVKALPFGEGLGGVELGEVSVFTTRADTLFGVTYVVISPEHNLVSELKSKILNWNEVEKFMRGEFKALPFGEGLGGVELKGIKAVNPANGEEIPVWVADYVLANYGTGAVMAVPAHDERDFEFSKKYNLPIKKVIESPEGFPSDKAYTGNGIVINSEKIPSASGLLNTDALEEILDELEYRGVAKRVTKYRMHDAIFARQRYWGEPIPLKHTKDGLIIPLKEKDLPLKLPNVKSYESTGTGEGPLAGVASWINAGYETNTMPGWAGSSWYFLRYTDPKNKKEMASKKSLNYWMKGGVDMYVGGAEHATGHLLYSRFWHKVLKDYGMVLTEEPFRVLKNQGMILGSDHRKMSKRWGNVTNPDDVVKTYGADTLRVYEMFMGPFEQMLPWSTESIIGSRRFIEKVWRVAQQLLTDADKKLINTDGSNQGSSVSDRGKSVNNFEKLLHKTIKKVTEDIEKFSFNTAISAMMILVNEMESAYAKGYGVTRKDFKMFLQILAPFAVHTTDEIWSTLTPTLSRRERGSIHLSKWPKFDPKKLVDDTMKIMIQVNSKIRGEMEVPVDITEDEIKSHAERNERILPWLSGKEIKRIIYVKGKLINILV